MFIEIVFVLLLLLLLTLNFTENKCCVSDAVAQSMLGEPVGYQKPTRKRKNTYRQFIPSPKGKKMRHTCASSAVIKGTWVSEG